MGKTDDVLGSTLACTTNCERRFCQLQNVRAAEPLNFPSPDGNIADVLGSTLACATVNASVNYSLYVPQ